MKPRLERIHFHPHSVISLMQSLPNSRTLFHQKIINFLQQFGLWLKLATKMCLNLGPVLIISTKQTRYPHLYGRPSTGTHPAHPTAWFYSPLQKGELFENTKATLKNHQTFQTHTHPWTPKAAAVFIPTLSYAPARNKTEREGPDPQHQLLIPLLKE